MVLGTSRQGSCWHLQKSMLSLNSSSSAQNCRKQVQLHVKGLKALRLPAAMVLGLTQASCNPAGQLHAHDSSNP